MKSITGMMWFQKPANAAAVQAGAKYHADKYGSAPTTVYVNKNDRTAIGEVAGIRVESSSYIQPCNFLFVVDSNQ